jgi:hypothetical protein
VTADSQVLSTRAADSAPAVTGSANPTGAQLAASFPPRPVASSWPATEATRSEVLARVLSAPFALDNRLSQQTRRLGVLAVLNWLRIQPGDSWQQRWRASGAEDRPDWRRLVGTDPAKPLPHLSPGLLVLICADAWTGCCGSRRRGTTLPSRWPARVIPRVRSATSPRCVAAAGSDCRASSRH